MDSAKDNDSSLNAVHNAAPSPLPESILSDLLGGASHSTPIQRQALASDLDAAILRSQDIINYHQNLLKLLQTKRNACSIMTRVPADVLLEIMWYSLDELEGSFDIIRLSSVSRRWRETALSSQKIWSCITAQVSRVDVKALELLLTRAKSYPLEVEMCVPPTCSLPYYGSVVGIQRLLDNIPRIGLLRIDMSYWENGLRALERALPARATNLTVFELKLDPEGSRLQLPFSLADCPSLESLHIDGHWTPEILPVPVSTTLRALKLNGPLMNDPPVADDTALRAVLAAARAMPHLQVLSFTHFVSVPSLPSAYADRHDPISLPHLELLELGGFTPLVNCILDCVTVPPSTRINIAFNPSSDSVADDLALQKKAIRLLHHRLSLIPAARLGAYWSVYVHATIDTEFWDPDWVGCGMRFGILDQAHALFKEPECCVSFFFSDTPQHLEFMDGIWKALSPEKVVHFCLEYDELTEAIPSSLLASRIPALVQMASFARSAQTILIEWPPEWLADTDILLRKPVGDGTENDHFLFPALRELAFRGGLTGDIPDYWTWTRDDLHKSKDASDSGESEPERCVDVLKTTLTSWEAGRGSIERVSFWETDLSEEDVQQLGLQAEIVMHN
ncbi:hypothetical protein EIP91_008268 [Steccherinum ochraceum]|uniref:Uncharacterized protein n=1 Tax=Steccherinum ochraceum TaxID=92696 RepID=A0A4R0R5G1_9APHY|nr:hypothetical protein EIP91_008268 [Steccherinum ochraceum]